MLSSEYNKWFSYLQVQLFKVLKISFLMTIFYFVSDEDLHKISIEIIQFEGVPFLSISTLLMLVVFGVIILMWNVHETVHAMANLQCSKHSRIYKPFDIIRNWKQSSARVQKIHTFNHRFSSEKKTNNRSIHRNRYWAINQKCVEIRQQHQQSQTIDDAPWIANQLKRKMFMQDIEWDNKGTLYVYTHAKTPNYGL